MYRWIAFDAVGTLLHPEPDVATAYATIGRKYGSRFSADDLRPRFRQAFADSTAICLPNNDGNLLTSEALETERWRWIIANVLHDVTDQDGCFAALYDHFARPENWRLFDDVASVLTQLRAAGYRLALASNFDQRLHPVCRGFPELTAIETVVVSTAVGTCKPSPRFYTRLLDICGCRPDELLMIGDDLEADVLGPRQMGIAAYLIDRRSQEPSETVLRSLAELPAKLGWYA